MKTVKVVAFALVAGLAMSAAAEPKYRATLTAAGYTGETTLTNFPVLVRISPDTISGFVYSQCATNGADISFKSAGQTLAHEIDTWNTNGESTVWVNLPTLATNTTFVMRWGDGDVTSTTSTSATWNDDYVGVWHMGEPSNTCANATSKGSKYDAEPHGKTQYCVRYEGDDAPVGYARQTGVSGGQTKYWSGGAQNYRSFLSVPSYHEENVGDTFTISGWVRLAELMTDNYYYRVFSKKATWDAADGFEVEMSASATKFNARTKWVNGTANEDVNGEFPSLLKSWVHVAFVFSNSTLRVYGNGVKMTANRETVTPVVENETPLAIGSNSSDSTDAGVYQPHLIGEFDECRLMKGAASADWVKAEYDTVKTTGFLTYGKAVCGFMLFIR